MTIIKAEVCGAGSPNPLGVTSNNENYNVAVYAPDASKVFIHFFTPDTEEFICKIELKNRTGKVFHSLISHVSENYVYALQAIQKDKRKGHCVDERLFIDPYAKSLNKSLVWNETQYHQQSAFMLPKAKLCKQEFDWQGVTKPNIARHESVIYELHVKGYSEQNPNVTEAVRGKYLGLSEPGSIDHLKGLGITAVQILPIFSFMSEPRLEQIGLTNYWGYNPINFFAPDQRYANNDAVTEVKTMVRELHRNGIEVILDVVYNHTAESGAQGPSLSFKGLVEGEFYLRTDDDYSFDYANYSGCGNTVNADSNFGIKIIMDSMRYWLTEMQVDGFRFDLAATLGRNGDRFNRKAALFRAMSQDPIISQAKLIAEPWDIGPEGYQLGNFPSEWLECNDRFRDTVRRFWRGELGLVPELASRILGSRDIFKKGRRSHTSSVNYVAYHDGYTLNDLVSYEQKHNESNLENNRDGHGSNFSKNYGVEGETTKAEVLALRAKQIRNMVSTVLFSQGVPHLLAGDEIGRTQKGNNNAYCQDNEISWLNWNLDRSNTELLEFTKLVISIRKSYPLLQRCFLEDDDYEYSDFHHHVNWIKPSGESKQIDDWQNNENQCLGLVVADDDNGYQLVLILNASEQSVTYKIVDNQPLSAVRILDTNLINQQLGSQIDCQFDRNLDHEQAPQSLSLWKLLPLQQ